MAVKEPLHKPQRTWYMERDVWSCQQATRKYVVYVRNFNHFENILMYFKCTKSQAKNEKFIKKAQSRNCGYTLEPPRF